MLDMGFIPDIERIFSLTPFTRQTLFFSATMAPEIERITKTFLSNPAKVEVARAATTGENIAQGLVQFKAHRRETEASEKRAVLRALIDGEGEALTNGIIFCNRKVDVDIVAKSLKKYGYDAEAIHGDLDQSQRTRTLDSFRDGKLRLLIASDVAARGLDIPAVSHVFNFDVPSHSEDYVHRIGRTGRAGRSGKALTIATPKDDKYLSAIESLIAKPIPRLDNPLKDAPPPPVREERPAREERPRREERRPRIRRNEERAPEAETAVAEPEPVAAEPPAREERPRRDRDERRPERSDRPDRDRRPRGEPRDDRVIGMGDDVPSFIAMSFAERRSA
jgi:ATP-dependent RNA helicase RhlE